MQWIKKGRIYQTSRRFEWSQSHAQLPIVDVTYEGKWRIYFATRGPGNRSSISYIEVEAGKPENILYEHDRPVLPFGALGSFDESGLMPACVVTQGHRKYLFYVGWSLKRTVPYHNSIGVAVSVDEGETFAKLAPGPLFASCLNEPYFTGTANVVIENGVWRAWYQSCTKWELIDGRPEPFYHLKYAESTDGITWLRQGVVAIDYKDEMEGGICSASVLRDIDCYRMWFSYRGAAGYRDDKAQTYRVGYAESPNGITWTRKDGEAGIDVSQAGWDSEMIAYPQVLDYGTRRFMFYNGNGFGRTGFGYAVAKIDGAKRSPGQEKS